MRKIILFTLCTCLITISCNDLNKTPKKNMDTVIEIEENDYYRVYIENDVTVHFLNNEEKMTGTFYVKKNNLLKEVMVLGNGLLFNTNKTYYPNGNVAQESKFRRGVKIGEEKQYYDTGELKATKNYSNNKIVGEEKQYYKTGELKSIMNYSNNKVVGKSIHYEKNGSINRTHENNNSKSFKNGILIGEEYEYNHKKKGILNVNKIYETDGSNKIKLMLASKDDMNEMFLFYFLDENHNITDSLNPQKNPEKLILLMQNLGVEFMD